MERVTEPPGREEQVNEVIAGYIQAVERGERPDPAEWLRRHPDLAEELTSFFADREQVERVLVPLCPTAPGSGAGRMLGPYELLEEIGRGGMGVVYRACQVALNRVVAVKTIRAAGGAGAPEVARFRAEAEAVAALDHPHIVPVHEAGEQDGQHFFAMKWIEGTSLAQALAEGRRPAGRAGQHQAARLLATLARAVHYAHQRGLLHRDLKPANILLDDRGEPHITDFGLARRLEGDCGLTTSGAIVGTPSYMAPEQAAGTGRLTTAADVYSLGAILYELLTGRPPFRAGSVLETLLQVRTEEPARPGGLQPGLDRDLETICLKCLHKDPGRRYSSAEALAADLERWSAGEPIQARPTGTWERAVKWGRRHPAWAVLAATSVLTAGLLLAYLGLRLDLAEADRRAAREQAELQQREKRLMTAHLALRNGTAELERGEIGPGLLWLVRGLEDAPDEDLQRSFRLLLAAWRQELHPLRLVFPVPPQIFPGLALAPDGRTLARGGSAAVPCGEDGRKLDAVELWDVTTGRRLGQPLTFPGRVTQLWFGRDGKTLAAELEHGTHFVDLATRKPVPEPKGFVPYEGPSSRETVRFGEATVAVGDPLPVAGEGRVLAVAPGGRSLLAVLDRKDNKGPDRVRPWDAATARPLGGPIDVGGFALAAQVSADGKEVTVAVVEQVTHGPDGVSLARVRHFVAATGAGFQRDQFPDVPFRGLGRAAPDGLTALLAGTEPRTYRFWDATTGRLLGPAFAQPNLQGEEFSPDGRLLFAHSDPGTGRLYDAHTGLPHGDRIHGGPGGIDWFSFTPDGRSLVASGGADVRVWDLAPVNRGRTLTGEGFLFAPRFSPDGRHVLAQNGDAVRRWEVATGRPLDPVPESRTGREVAVTADGRRSLTVEQGRGLFVLARLWDEDGKPVGDPIRLATTVERNWNAPGFSPDGSLVVGRDGNVARLWEAATGAGLERAFDHGAEIRAVAVSPDGRLLVTGGADGLVRRWDAGTGEAVGEPLRHQGPVEHLVFSPDGRRLLTDENPSAVRGLRARLWDAVTGEPLGAALVHGGGLGSAPTFSPDGRRILGAADRDHARQWDAETGKPLGGLLFHGRQMDDFVYSPDGTVIATAGLAPYPDDRFARPEFDRARVRFWDAATCTPLGPPRMLGRSGNTGVRFSPNGRTLLAANANELLLLPSPRPVEGEAERLRLWVEVSTGLELAADGALVELDAAAWQTRHRQLAELVGPP
jgi:WD40 repeat protein